MGVELTFFLAERVSVGHVILIDNNAAIEMLPQIYIWVIKTVLFCNGVIM